jgi:hypothetical protein
MTDEDTDRDVGPPATPHEPAPDVMDIRQASFRAQREIARRERWIERGVILGLVVLASLVVLGVWRLVA